MNIRILSCAEQEFAQAVDYYNDVNIYHLTVLVSILLQ